MNIAIVDSNRQRITSIQAALSVLGTRVSVHVEAIEPGLGLSRCAAIASCQVDLFIAHETDMGLAPTEVLSDFAELTPRVYISHSYSPRHPIYTSDHNATKVVSLGSRALLDLVSAFLADWLHSDRPNVCLLALPTRIDAPARIGLLCQVYVLARSCASCTSSAWAYRAWWKNHGCCCAGAALPGGLAEGPDIPADYWQALGPTRESVLAQLGCPLTKHGGLHHTAALLQRVLPTRELEVAGSEEASGQELDGLVVRAFDELLRRRWAHRRQALSHDLITHVLVRDVRLLKNDLAHESPSRSRISSAMQGIVATWEAVTSELNALMIERSGQATPAPGSPVEAVHAMRSKVASALDSARSCVSDSAVSELPCFLKEIETALEGLSAALGYFCEEREQS